MEKSFIFNEKQKKNLLLLNNKASSVKKILNFKNKKLSSDKSVNKKFDILNFGVENYSPSAGNMWRNTVYNFNKQSTKHFPVLDLNISNLLKSYFNMYNKNFEKKVNLGSKRFRLRFRRTSVNKLFTSKINVKHTNSNVLLTVSVFNPERLFLLRHWKKEKLIKKWGNRRFNRRGKFTRAFKKFKFILKKKTLGRLSRTSLFLSLLNYQYNNVLLFFLHNKEYKSKLVYYYLIKTQNLWKRIIFKRIKYKYLLFINKYKYQSIYINKLTDLISLLYKKSVKLNIINVKNMHTNSDILTKIITMKLRNRDNRIFRIIKVFLRSVNKAEIRVIKDKLPKFIFSLKSSTGTYIQKLNLNKNIFKFNKYDITSIIYNLHNNLWNISKFVFRNLSNKHVTGIRLESRGRLTKRLTAARALRHTKYIGTLKDIYSSYWGISRSLVRGHVQNNLQYTVANYKTRIGAYGIKGWVSSY